MGRGETRTTSRSAAFEARRLVLGSFALAVAVQSGAQTPVPVHPGVVLHETHTQSSVAEIDTIHTYFTPEHVLIVHDGGRTLLDLRESRIVLLDRETHTARTMSFQEWETQLQEAAGARDTTTEEGGRFEAQGSNEVIAGFRCERYHHFGQRTLLGSQEYVEQQIWVTREIDVPAAAYEAYRRAFDRIDSIGRPVTLRRPPGVVLAVETRTRPVDADRRNSQVERYSVYAVEERALPDSLFHVPRSYRRAGGVDRCVRVR